MKVKKIIIITNNRKNTELLRSCSAITLAREVSSANFQLSADVGTSYQTEAAFLVVQQDSGLDDQCAEGGGQNFIFFRISFKFKIIQYFKFKTWYIKKKLPLNE